MVPPLSKFLSDDLDVVLGVVVKTSSENGSTDLKQRQTKAWHVQLEILRHSITSLTQHYPDAPGWGLLIAYPIPRRQKRVDAVLREAVFGK